MKLVLLLAAMALSLTLTALSPASVPVPQPQGRCAQAPDGGWRSADGGYRPPPACPFW